MMATPALIKLTGDLDIYHVPELEAALSAIGAGDVIDLSTVRFIDAAAIGIFVRLARRAGLSSVTLVVPPGPVRKTFELVLVNKLFTIVDTYNNGA